MARVSFLLIIFALAAPPAIAQLSVIGKWQTIDDTSQEVRSIVELFELDGKIHGKIVKIYLKPGETPDPLCTACDPADDRYNKKVIGMEILRGMQQEKDSYAGGEILDPEAGKVYRCRIWLENGLLKVRGYWGPFFQTQTWKRAQ